MRHQKLQSISRKFLAICAAGALCLTGFLPTYTAWADTEETEEEEEDDDSSFTDGTLTYSYVSDTEVEVLYCDSSAVTANVLSEIDGYEIVAIADEAFANCEDLIGVSIASSVLEIGEAAFYGCTSLTDLTIPDSVTEIEAGCFFNCTALETIDLGDSITYIDDMAFGYCTSLTEITLPDSLESIGDELFYYCTALETVEFPESVTELGDYTFYGCMSMTEYTIPATMEDIGSMTFFGCQAMETIEVEEGNEYYCVEDNVLYDIDQTILYLYPPARTDTSFTLPDSVLVIYAGAFFYAYNLTEIDLGENLQYIGEIAFDFCTGLIDLTIPESVTYIGSTAFSDCTGLTSITFTGAADEDGGEGEDLEIGDYAFFCCDNVKKIQLPKRVSSIGDYAFGVTESDEDEAEGDAISVETDSGTTMILEPIEDFVLVGYSGTAKDYAKDCEVDIDFEALDFDWSAFLFYAIIILVALIVILLAIRLIYTTMARKDEVVEAEEEEEEVFDDGYQPILSDDDDEEISPVTTYDQTLDHGPVHQLQGHSVTAAEGATPEEAETNSEMTDANTETEVPTEKQATATEEAAETDIQPENPASDTPADTNPSI